MNREEIIEKMEKKYSPGQKLGDRNNPASWLLPAINKASNGAAYSHINQYLGYLKSEGITLDREDTINLEAFRQLQLTQETAKTAINNYLDKALRDCEGIMRDYKGCRGKYEIERALELAKECDIQVPQERIQEVREKIDSAHLAHVINNLQRVHFGSGYGPGLIDKIKKIAESLNNRKGHQEEFEKAKQDVNYAKSLGIDTSASKPIEYKIKQELRLLERISQTFSHDLENLVNDSKSQNPKTENNIPTSPQSRPQKTSFWETIKRGYNHLVQ